MFLFCTCYLTKFWFQTVLQNLLYHYNLLWYAFASFHNVFVQICSSFFQGAESSESPNMAVKSVPEIRSSFLLFNSYFFVWFSLFVCWQQHVRYRNEIVSSPLIMGCLWAPMPSIKTVSMDTIFAANNRMKARFMPERI